jgi:hypothetical protein
VERDEAYAMGASASSNERQEEVGGRGGSGFIVGRT